MPRWPYGPLGSGLFRDDRKYLNKMLEYIGLDAKEQKERVDNLIKNTPQPSEVVDMRLDEEGVEHANARDRLISDKAKLQVQIDDANVLLTEKAKDIETLFDLGIFMEDKEIKKLNVETDDTLSIARAIQKATETGKRNIYFSSRKYTVSSKITITVDDLHFIGTGGNFTKLENSNDTTMFDIQSFGVHFRDIAITVTDINRTNYPIVLTGASRPVFESVYFSGVDGSYRSGLHFNGGSMGTVEKCYFNHSCIRVDTWDVKINKCYIWAMSCEYGIGVYNAAGNLKVTDTDIVPPLKTFSKGKSGIWVDGESGACYNIHLEVYLDGNPTLSTREGIIINKNAGNVTILVKANRMDSDVVIIDSAIGVDVYSGKFHNNNDKGIGAREIVVKQTGNQVPHVRIHDCDFIMTRDIVGTKAPCIEIDASVTDQQYIEIVDNRIKQPPSLNGYTDPEILCNSAIVNLKGNKGTSSLYFAKGSVSVASGASSITVAFPKSMAYEPLLSDYTFQWEGTAVPFRIQKNGRSNVFVSFTNVLTTAAILHYKVELSR
ncbi:hypothetical protein ACUIJN_11945 [Metabacillus halosaccharovorans]|uniref:hypothetical protein n=1 Tax=Metabacillus halosaccharovorans TaxID=930124 RepID=UPI00403D86E0